MSLTYLIFLLESSKSAKHDAGFRDVYARPGN